VIKPSAGNFSASTRVRARVPTVAHDSVLDWEAQLSHFAGSDGRDSFFDTRSVELGVLRLILASVVHAPYS